MKKPAQKLANYFKDHELNIAFAESITCGCAAHCMGNVIGTSGFFKGSIVCYDESVKLSLFRIRPSLLKKFTAESQEVTDALAKNLKLLIDADIHAAITGLAAPGGSETTDKPVGTVFFSFMFKRKLYKKRTRLNGTPLQIREKACKELFKFIAASLKQSE